jgi:aminoglycoside phosphotransferase (APT) family kinase protein
MDAAHTQSVLSAALAALHGGAARLVRWSVHDGFTAYGKRRVVRYELEAMVGAAGTARRYEWLGKFYDDDRDARRVASVLRQLAEVAASGARTGPTVPGVIAYHAPERLLLLTYEPGEPVASVIGHTTQAVVSAMGRALAALHAAPIVLEETVSPPWPATVLADLQPRVAELCGRFPEEAAALERARAALERTAPPPPPSLCFVHGDFGPANLLWRLGQVVVLDFDKCTSGDPALDLGNLLAQLFRMSLRKPDRLPDFAAARAGVLDAYRRWSRPDRPDPGLEARVAWYQQATLLRKIHRLTFNTTRHPGPEGLRQRQVEAERLLAVGTRG